jgi:hypothetical protein
MVMQFIIASRLILSLTPGSIVRIISDDRRITPIRPIKRYVVLLNAFIEKNDCDEFEISSILNILIE